MTAPRAYGSWPSPLSAAAVASAAPRIEGARFDRDAMLWGETVAAEGGRTSIRTLDTDGGVVDLLPAPWSARSRVHEYGGGSWAVTGRDSFAFVEKTDQRVWLSRSGAAPVPLTPAAGAMRFGGLTLQAGRLLAVRETHTGASPRRDIVEIPLDGRAADSPRSLVSIVADSTFLAQPALSPDGTHLAWIAWDHPHMPWDAAELRIGRLEQGRVAEWTAVVSGGTAPLQPIWLTDDELLYADDPDGRWNLWRVRLTADLPRRSVAPSDADTGGGLWVLGLRWFSALEDGRIVAIRTNGDDELVVIDTDGDVRVLDVPPFSQLNIEDTRDTRVLVSGSGRGGAGLWHIDVDSPEHAVTVTGGTSIWGEEWMPRGDAVTFDGAHGPVHAFDFAPTNPNAGAPADERPPYVVFVHGGPTSHVGSAASTKIAYFTSRGIGVLDVNYGGSTGYGRAYRERLKGQWGVVDVDDVVTAARGLAASGVADPARLAIAGGSAGGWTVLCALARSDAFSAGISRYGVADLRRLVEDTHDFEARYLDGLVGPLPEAEEIYIARSPLSSLDDMRTPMLIEQGLDDEVVPPSQSEAVRDALAANGVAHAYLAFEGEGHGFRRAETVVRQLEAEVAFLGAVLGFTPDGMPPLTLS